MTLGECLSPSPSLSFHPTPFKYTKSNSYTEHTFSAQFNNPTPQTNISEIRIHT